MKYSRRVAYRVVDGQAFVLDTKGKVLHRFNAVGTRLWQLLGQGADAEAAARTVAREFDVEYGRAAEDARAFIGTLKAERLLEDA